ncbi:MAG: FAD-dependent monooxygenase [Prolixibacteraceae bacterium]|nr:FAD-dependent monooxygenase [Prolixibacteraceae bacterium]
MVQIDSTIDVLISGAGPVGLMMACQLALHNISFRIIDKKTSPVMYSGALIVHARTLEILGQMGIAQKAIEAGIVAQTINIRFNQPKNYTLDISDLGIGLTRFPFLLMIEQWQTENLLTGFLNDHGRFVENNTTLVNFTPEKELVTSEIQKPDGTIEIVKSKFLIGADGNNSLVRTKLNIPFPGKTHLARLFITDCEAQLPFRTNEIFFSFTTTHTAGFFPLPENRRRVDGLIPVIQQKEQVGFDDVSNFFDSDVHSGIQLRNPQWFSVFRSHSRCAHTYRQNRCFLVGDAAHVHSPVGAQGMNTGLQDAHNLAWKMALYISGKAPENILESYQEERRPLAQTIIKSTDFAYSFMTANSMLVRFLRLKLVPVLLPFFLRKFKNSTRLRNRIFTSISGIGIKYNQNLTLGSLEKFPAHAPKTGERLPQLEYEMGGKTCSIYDGLDSKTFHLFVFGKQILAEPFRLVLDKFSEIISVKYIPHEPETQHLFKSFGLGNEGCYLVRPDLYIAWRSRELNAASVGNYLQKITI